MHTRQVVEVAVVSAEGGKVTGHNGKTTVLKGIITYITHVTSGHNCQTTVLKGTSTAVQIFYYQLKYLLLRYFYCFVEISCCSVRLEGLEDMGDILLPG
jgi:hypothetical protein